MLNLKLAPRDVDKVIQRKSLPSYKKNKQYHTTCFFSFSGYSKGGYSERQTFTNVSSSLTFFPKSLALIPYGERKHYPFWKKLFNLRIKNKHVFTIMAQLVAVQSTLSKTK